MDYSNGDLTLQRYYEPIKLSFVTNPNDPALGDAIWKNLSELDTLTHTAAPGAIAHIDAFKKFLATANTNNNIGNVIAYGDRHAQGHNSLTRRLADIDRQILQNAERHGKRFPHLQTIADLWNEFKVGIPEKTALVSRNYRDTILTLEEQTQSAKTPESKAQWNAQLQRTRANFAIYQAELEKIAPATPLARDWQAAAAPEQPARLSLGEVFGNLRRAASGLLPSDPVQARENSR